MVISNKVVVSLLSLLLSFSCSIANADSLLPETYNIVEGDWQADIPGNRYQMRVIWSQSQGKFLGYLIKQGKGSLDVGFTISEHVWSAKSENGQLVEYQKWRRGANGKSYSYEWATGLVRIDLSSKDILITTTSRFERVN